MAKNDALFELILSLDEGEKRHFRKYALGNGKASNYLRLFDHMAACSNYDEKALRRAFVGERFLKQLHVTKNYLYRMILRALRDLHAEENSAAELRALIHEAEILLRKQLHAQCATRLRKAAKLAERYEMPYLGAQISDLRRQLANATGKDSREITRRESVQVREISLRNSYWQILPDLFEYSGPEGFERLLSQPALQADTQGIGLRTLTLRYHMLYGAALMSGHAEKGETLLKELIAKWEARPALVRDSPNAYVAALNNLTGMYLRQRRSAEVEAQLRKVAQVPETFGLPQGSPFTLRMLLRNYNMRLEFLRDAGRYDEAAALIPEAEAFLTRAGGRAPRSYHLLLPFQFTGIEFERVRFREALHWSNRILAANFGEERADLLTFNRFMNLVIHFELGNIMVLRYAADSTRCFLRKRKQIRPFEKAIVRTFARLSVVPATEFKALLQGLYQELFEKEKPLMDTNDLDYFDLKGYLERKLGR